MLTGSVVNVSRGKTPAANTDVVLRIRLDKDFVPFDETKTDSQGRFRFNHLPIGKEYVFLPGANRDGVHYPGPRFQLMPERPCGSVTLAVYDSVAEPNPLVIRRQEVTLRPEPEAVYVTESILVDNPTSSCYVGRALHEGWEPITLRLAIPSDFERTTFHDEFLGRRFAIFDGHLVTGIAWPPGQREVKFTYVVPNKNPCYRWNRSLDLPCFALHVRVENLKPHQVTCNLHRGADEENGTLAFNSAGETLPGGYAISVELGRFSAPFMTYARWLALGVLMVLIVVTSMIGIQRRRARRRAVVGLKSSETPTATVSFSGQERLAPSASQADASSRRAA